MNNEDIRDMVIQHAEQIKTLFAQQKELKELAESTYKLATSVEMLVMRVDHTDSRLNEIEGSSKYKTNVIWACTVSVAIGAVITFVINSILGA